MTPEERREKVVAVVTDRRVQLMVLIFLVALVPRLMFMEHGLWQDEGRAMTIARNVLQGEGFTFRERPMMQHPFMFYILLAAAFIVFGATDVAGILVVGVLGALTAVVAYLLGEELYNRYTGVAAGVFLAFSPIHWFISGRVLNDVPVVFFMTLAAYLFIKSERADSTKLFYAAAGVTAVAALTKLTGMILLPIFGLYALYKHRLDVFHVRRYWIGAGIFLALFALWEVRNIVFVGESGAWNVFHQFFIQQAVEGSQFLQRDQSLLYYAVNLPQFLGAPVVVLFLVGSVFSYLYNEKNAVFPALYLAVIFLAFTLKATNLLRYFLPFAPVAVVVAGYGVDRIRRSVAALAGDTPGTVVYLFLILASVGFIYPAAAANIQAKSQGYTGLEEAGNWLQANTHPDDVIMAGSTNQIAWYSNRDKVLPAWAPSENEVDAYVRDHNVSYIVIDRWEVLLQSQAPYAFRFYTEHPNYTAVQGFGSGQGADVVIYEPRFE